MKVQEGKFYKFKDNKPYGHLYFVGKIHKSHLNGIYFEPKTMGEFNAKITNDEFRENPSIMEITRQEFIDSYSGDKKELQITIDKYNFAITLPLIF